MRAREPVGSALRTTHAAWGVHIGSQSEPYILAPDAGSIFTDLEFSAGCKGGLFTLDKFGGVFALGTTRPDPADPVPGFGNSPYFFPFLYAEDIEVFGADESEVGPGPGPTVTPGPGTKFSPFIWEDLCFRNNQGPAGIRLPGHCFFCRPGVDLLGGQARSALLGFPQGQPILTCFPRHNM
jgi:hypothetical protein